METPSAMAIVFRVILLAALVLLNGFFVAVEYALVRLRQTQLEPLLARGDWRARIAKGLLDNLNGALSATQLGVTLASLGLGWAGEPVVLALLAPMFDLVQLADGPVRHYLAFAAGFSVITLLHVVVGELAPKWLAIRQPLPFALWLAPPLAGFYRVSFPFIWIINATAQGLLRRLGIEPVTATEGDHSQEELRLLFAASHRQTGGTLLGRDIVINAFDLGRRRTREVMRPRQEMVALDTEATIAACLDVAEKTRFSRFPLCAGGDLDQLLGVVHIKDLYAARLKARTGAELAPVARPLIYVPPTARLEKLLQLFLDRKLHLAVVVDEYGGTIGLVTLENILEELVGQIQDEFDQEKPLVVSAGDGVWELAGTLPLHELAELVGEPLAGEGSTTTSGWLTHRLGGFPRPGDAVAVGAFDLRVEEMDGPRVARLRLVRRVS